MRVRLVQRFMIAAVLLTAGAAGCKRSVIANAAPAPDTIVRNDAETMKKLEGVWLLKSSSVSTERGVYSLTSPDSPTVHFRIQDGVMEVREGDAPWSPYANLSLGIEPQCLMMSKADVLGQQRLLPNRYKLEGDTLTIVQDNLYPDVLPDSFELEAISDRQRQINVYIRVEDKPKKAG